MKTTLAAALAASALLAACGNNQGGASGGQSDLAFIESVCVKVYKDQTYCECESGALKSALSNDNMKYLMDIYKGVDAKIAGGESADPMLIQTESTAYFTKLINAGDATPDQVMEIGGDFMAAAGDTMEACGIPSMGG